MVLWLVFHLDEFGFFECPFSTKEKAISYIDKKQQEPGGDIESYFIHQWEVDKEKPVSKSLIMVDAPRDIGRLGD